MKKIPCSRKAPAIQRYWARVDTSGGADACWPWIGHLRYGYGIFHDAGRQYGAHRWGYAQRVGEIPDGHGVLHHCDNPPCQNDRHWFTGTQRDNNADKMRKGRQRNAYGTKHHNARLTEDDVRSIRRQYEKGLITHAALAEDFGVAEPTVWKILNRKVWKHVD